MLRIVCAARMHDIWLRYDEVLAPAIHLFNINAVRGAPFIIFRAALQRTFPLLPFIEHFLLMAYIVTELKHRAYTDAEQQTR